MKGQGFTRRITSANLEQFAPLLRQGNEAGAEEVSSLEASISATDADAANRSDKERGLLAAALALFQGESIKVRNPTGGRTSASGAHGSSAAREPERMRLALGDLMVERREVLWTKTLARSDVGRQKGNFTGGVRLAKAGFHTATGLIDQTTYFRQTVFGHLTWRVGRERPFREDAEALFTVRVRDTDLGTHRLRITHKPTGEAGQNNYTTTLHWGGLGATIRPMGLDGSVLTLYAPDVEDGPYLIEVR